MDYDAWVSGKADVAHHVGMDVDPARLNSAMFPFQRRIVAWALRRGRAAVFADTGLGKSLKQLAWADAVAGDDGRVLVLAPLAVAQQTVREAKKFGVEGVSYQRSDIGGRIVVTNYEMLGSFDPRLFRGVVLDESSILKAYDGRTRTAIIEAFADTPMKLACTATPAPNDHMELGNHAEFLGYKSRAEMLATYFVHDGGSTQKWRLKGHAVGDFWQWVCSWAAMVRKPSDLGYADDGYDLHPLVSESIDIAVDIEDAHRDGLLLPRVAVTLADQRSVRRSTLDKRVAAIAEHVASEPGEPALIWCQLNAEGDALERAIPDAVQVSGSDSLDEKVAKLLGFTDGTHRVLVTKPSIAGFGMNWQHCARMYFFGPTHSYEQRYQSIRRCWRFGQTRPVIVRTCIADTERAVVANYERKHAQAEEMARHMAESIAVNGLCADGAISRWDAYTPETMMEVPKWLTTDFA